MKVEAMERYLGAMFQGLVEADEADERREFMNAILRIAAMVIYESTEPEKSREIAIAVIDAALDEPEEMLQ